MKKKSILIGVCCFLALLTGVVVIEGEQEVQQLKTTGKNSQMTEGEKESPLTGIIDRHKRQTDLRGNANQCNARGRDGKDGRDGRDGQPGLAGHPGPKGSEGPVGPKGERGATRSSGTTYVRWGRSVCPNGAERIYSGIASGSKHNLGGGTDQTLCLPNDPKYFPGDTMTGLYGTLWGIRYEVYTKYTTVPLNIRAGLKMPCAVCYTSTRSAVLTIPARYSCPSGWRLEYNGYLMSEHTISGRPRKDTICADRYGESAGAYTPFPSVNLLMNVHCDEGLVCPPYAANKPLTCAVCSK